MKNTFRFLIFTAVLICALIFADFLAKKLFIQKQTSKEMIRRIEDIQAEIKQYEPIKEIPKIETIEIQETDEENRSLSVASWYDYKLDGIPWSLSHRTAASRDLPRYSYATVTNIENDKSVVVFINDYGPMNCEDRVTNGFDMSVENCIDRTIDLSSHAFSQIADLQLGLIEVYIEPFNNI